MPCNHADMHGMTWGFLIRPTIRSSGSAPNVLEKTENRTLALFTWIALNFPATKSAENDHTFFVGKNTRIYVARVL